MATLAPVTSLMERIASTTARASDGGALISVPTRTTLIEDRGIPFVIHITTLQEKKRRAKVEDVDRDFNPFLPPDPELFIDEISPSHVSVLNKFNVLDHHLLIVTRRFEPQEALLNRGDFEALATCMVEIDGLGFYNGGTVAGASQPHKHLQLVPLPLGRGPKPTPLDSILSATTETGDPVTVPVLPFDHTLITLGGSPPGGHRAEKLEQFYRRACSSVGVHDETQPYNLLLTRRWMLVVPRSREHWRGVSINALGFAGSLLVRNQNELDQLKDTGPLAVLKSVVDDHPRDKDSP
jgi:sulfate adenylyltransferase (ADP) / ATP adenylyltransferase